MTSPPQQLPVTSALGPVFSLLCSNRKGSLVRHQVLNFKKFSYEPEMSNKAYNDSCHVKRGGKKRKRWQLVTKWQDSCCCEGAVYATRHKYLIGNHKTFAENVPCIQAPVYPPYPQVRFGDIALGEEFQIVNDKRLVEGSDFSGIIQ